MSGIAPNPLNGISKVYLEAVAAKPDFLDLDKDGNKKEPMKKAAKEVEAPKERLKTDRNMFNVPKDEQKAAKERLLAKARAKRAKMSEGLDPVGKEDKDVDNDGDHDKSDKYLLKRRKAISKAMKKRMNEGVRDLDPEKGTKERKERLEKKRGMKLDDHPEYKKEEVEIAEIHVQAHKPHEVPSKNLKGLVSKAVKRIDADNDGDVDKDDPKEKGMGEFVPSVDGKKKVRTKIGESVSNWRQDLSEIMTDDIDSKPIKEKSGIKNKVKINPKLGEAIEQLGGEIIEMVQLDEMPYQVMGSPDGKKEKKIGKPVKSRKYADARAAELSDTHKKTGGKYRSQYVEEIEIGDIIESVYDELVEEGYSQDEVEYGIDTALNTLEEGYYDSAVAASKAKSQAAPAPKRSLKDRIKSVAKKAITRGSYAAGRAMKAKAKVQAAPDRAKKKVRSIADRVKSAAKAGYAAGRGPVEKKSKTAYRGAGVGRKEKIGEEIEIEEGIGMTMAKAVGNPPALSKRMKLKQALLNREIKKNAAKNKKKSYSGKAVSEAVKGQDTESRKEAAAERKKGDKRLSPSKGKGYADQQKQSIAYHDKVSKKSKIIPGMTHEAVDATPYGGPDKLLQKLAPKHGGGQVVPLAPKKSANVQKAHFEPEGEQIDEKINMKKADMGDVVKDFYKSKAPQFKGKSKEKRREMAIAAKLTAERGGKRLGEQQQQQEPGQRKMISNMTQLQMKKQQMDRRKLQMKKRGEIPINTESVES